MHAVRLHLPYAITLLVISALAAPPQHAALDPAPRSVVVVKSPRAVVVDNAIDDRCEIDEVLPEGGPGFVWGHTKLTRQRCAIRIPHDRRQHRGRTCGSFEDTPALRRRLVELELRARVARLAHALRTLFSPRREPT